MGFLQRFNNPRKWLKQIDLLQKLIPSLQHKIPIPLMGAIDQDFVTVQFSNRNTQILRLR
jgi:hypothetical protein